MVIVAARKQKIDFVIWFAWVARHAARSGALKLTCSLPNDKNDKMEEES